MTCLADRIAHLACGVAAAFTVGLVSLAGCYSDLDFTKIKCGPSDPCPGGHVCGSQGLCVPAGASTDGGGAIEVWAPPIQDGPSIDGPGGEAAAPARVDGSAMDAGASDVPAAPSADIPLPGLDAKRDRWEPDVPLAEDVPADGADGSATGLDGSVDGGGEAGPTGPRWSPAKNLLGLADYGGPPSVAVSPTTGDAVVVWTTYGSQGVKAVRYHADTDTWGAPVAITDRNGIYEAVVAVDGNGHYAVIWAQRYDPVPPVARGIWASFSGDGATWSASPVLVYDGGSNSWDADLSIAMNGTGQARVVWDHFRSPDNGTNHHKLFSAYLQGSSFSPGLELADCGTYDHYCQPRVTITGSGSGIVAWKQNDTVSGNDDVWAASFTGQAMGAPALLENWDYDDANFIEVAMNGVGQGIAVWQQQGSSAGTDLLARRFSVANGWDVPVTIARGRAGGVLSAALDGFGTAFVGWSQWLRSAGAYQATFSMQPVGAAWTTEMMETDDVSPGYIVWTDIEPQVALGPAGSVLFAWRKKLSGTEFAPHARWRIGNVWGPESQLDMVPDLFAESLRFSVTGDGRAVAAWTYSWCDSTWKYADEVCPTAKDRSALSPASLDAWGGVFVSVYR